MSLRQYTWEATHILAIVAVITTLTVVIHLTGTRIVLPAARTATASDPALRALPADPARPAHTPERSDPQVIVVGPSDISNRYKLLSVDRKPHSPTSDNLTLHLHVESLALDNLVSPFESGMLEIRSEGLSPIKPKVAFRLPLPSGSSRTQKVVFSVPSNLNLDRTILQIHYYNYQNEIPLGPAH